MYTVAKNGNLKSAVFRLLTFIFLYFLLFYVFIYLFFAKPTFLRIILLVFIYLRGQE